MTQVNLFHCVVYCFMTELQEKVLSEIKVKPNLWWRYIDDIFFLWEHGEDTLKEFIEHLNEKYPDIKFTAECSQTSMNFLDLTVYSRFVCQTYW